MSVTQNNSLECSPAKCTLKLAAVISHPIQYFAPWFRAIAELPTIDLHVIFGCDSGVERYHDAGFNREVQWDVPLLTGYKHEFLPGSRPSGRFGFWNTNSQFVGAALDRFNPDVVLVFGYAHGISWQAVRWCRRRNRLAILCSDSNANAKTSSWRRLIKSPVVHGFYRYLDGAWCVSDCNRKYHAQYGMPEDRLYDGALPIDGNYLLSTVPDRAQARENVRRRHKIPEDAFVVNQCSKYVVWKSPLDLVSAVRAAQENGVPAWALLVGDGPERAKIELFCREQGIENVTLTGFVNQSKIGEYYAASDTICLCSAHEPYGLAITEGTFFGLPAIVSDRVGCAGANDVARNGVNAMVYPFGDLKALRVAIERLYREPKLHQTMATASLAVSKTQDSAYVAKQLADAVHQLHEVGKR